MPPEAPMETRRLGTQGLEVGAIGLGCMGMSEFYGPRDEAEGVATIHRALELGVTLLDTADVYGPHTQRAAGRRGAPRADGDEVVLATKFGIVRGSDGPWRAASNGRPEYVRASCDEPEAARAGHDRPLLPAPGRPEDADRGDGRRHGRAGPRGQGALPRALRGRRRRRSAGPTPSTRSRALQTEYSLWSRASPRRDPRRLPRAGHRLRGLQPPRPRVPDRPLPHPGRPRPGRLAAPVLPLPGREHRGEPRLARPVFEMARGEGLHRPPARPRLGAGEGGGADPGHEATEVPRGEPGQPRRLSSRRRRSPGSTPSSPSGAARGERYGAVAATLLDR